MIKGRYRHSPVMPAVQCDKEPIKDVKEHCAGANAPNEGQDDLGGGALHPGRQFVFSHFSPAASVPYWGAL
jgi:hypothetical protein